MPPPRIVLHADMDAFYASIEQRDEPSLRGKAVIVGGASARGVVSAASYEARVFGVRSAMPGFRARELCPHGVFVRPNMAKYTRVSDEVHDVLHRFSPDVEPLALDEAFLDVTGSAHLFGGTLELGRRLKRAVRDELGLAVSVGIASSKLVAKLACTVSKPDGFILVPDDAVRWFLDPLPVRRLFGVGPMLDEALRGLGIHTVADLLRYDSARLASAIGDRAHGLQRFARGEDDRAVEASLAPKSIGEENTFERDVRARDAITQALTSHAETVARRLRAEGLAGRTVTVKVKLGKSEKTRTSRTAVGEKEPVYPLHTRSKTLTQPTSDGAAIRDVAVALWDAAGIGEAVRLLGVTVSNLEARPPQQLDLFGKTRGEDRLGPALDAITARFGKGAIRRAVDAPEKATESDRKKRGGD